MIKTIIKRSGKHEPFNPAKVNGWGEWASKTLGGRVDWASGVLHTVSTSPETCTSEALQLSLIDYFINRNTYEDARVAGRLYAALRSKILYGKKKPTIRELHTTLIDAKLMVNMSYSPSDYELIEDIIQHSRDLKMTWGQINQLRNKYALQDRVSGVEFETPQFIYIRMAMALAENLNDRLVHIKNWYDYFSKFKLNPPTPNFTNLGTPHNGYASCCLYTTADTAPSLAAGDHIAYMMTVMSAGIGSHIKTRSLGDPVRGGLIHHQGKLPYFRSLTGAIGANLQNGRGGAATEHFTAYDPEIDSLLVLKNPMTPLKKQVRGIDYSFGSNKVFAAAVARNEEYALFSYQGNEELYEAQYKSGNEFSKLYSEYMASDRPKVMRNARDILVKAGIESVETGRSYFHQTDTLNTHTPFKDTIYSSNLCQEIAEPTKPYINAGQLYEDWNETHGEIALCSIAGIIVSNIESDIEYADVAYYALLMIDVCIHKSVYPFKSLEYTAKSRMNAGVGVLGLAHSMAKKHLKWDTIEGRNYIHEVFETHAYHLINASLRLGKELGNAPWMSKTKWPDGWLPIDTYEKRVDTLVTVENKRDWESLRSEIIKNKGIRNSVTTAHMPGESSTQAAGTTNGVYPIRDFWLLKTNDTGVNHWVAPDSTELKDYYQLSWDISSQNMLFNYAVIQKWTDQAISADLWRRIQGNETVGTTEIIEDYLTLVKYGGKSRYYYNSLTAKDKPSEEILIVEQLEESEEDQANCSGCSL